MTSAPVDPEEGVVSEDAPEVKPRLDLKVEVVAPSACERHVSVTVPAADIERYFSDAVAELVPKANVPGFRAGKAPRKLVESHFRRDLREQIKGTLLLESINQVTEDESFSAISEPDFDIEAIKLPDEGPLTFEFDIEVRPEFELPNWKGMKLERPVREVTSSDVDAHLREAFGRELPTVSVDRGILPGDVVAVDLTFHHQGNEVSTIEGELVEVRENLSFADGTLVGFDKLMAGAKAGDERRGTIELSEDAHAEALRGEKLEVVVTVKSVEEIDLKDLESFIVSRLGESDIGSVKDRVKSNLKNRIFYHARKKIREQITNLLAEAASWELPPKLLKSQSERELERALMELRSSGFSEREIRSQVNFLRQNSQRSTKSALKEHFVLEKIAEAENLDVSDEDFDHQIVAMAMQSGESPRSVRSRIEKQGLFDVLRNQIVEQKVIDRIQEHAHFRDVPFQFDVPDTTAIDFAIAGKFEPASIPVAKYDEAARELAQPTDRT